MMGQVETTATGVAEGTGTDPTFDATKALRVSGAVTATPSAVGAGTAAEAGRVVIATDQTAIPTQAVRSNIVYPTLLITDGAYAAGDNIGPLGEISGLPVSSLIAPAGFIIGERSAVMTTMAIAQVTFFEGNPSASTTTDGAAYSLAAADYIKVARMSAPGAVTQTAGVSYWTAGSFPARIMTDAAGKIYFGLVATGVVAITPGTTLKGRFEYTY
jgi:hypothetical protein